MFRLKIDNESSVPIYRQVVQAIKVEILSTRLKEGDYLPTIEELAGILKLNPNTVKKIYNTLIQEGLLAKRQGRGHWIEQKKQSKDSLKRLLLEEDFRNFVDRASVYGANLSDINALMEKYIHRKDEE
ncbi:MAG: GntR family transcriptional regulator [bacterium]|nr:GntR family transcriptional regulator [bacterium]